MLSTRSWRIPELEVFISLHLLLPRKQEIPVKHSSKNWCQTLKHSTQVMALNSQPTQTWNKSCKPVTKTSEASLSSKIPWFMLIHDSQLSPFHRTPVMLLFSSATEMAARFLHCQAVQLPRKVVSYGLSISPRALEISQMGRFSMLRLIADKLPNQFLWVSTWRAH